jgi:hypothetical protein
MFGGRARLERALLDIVQRKGVFLTSTDLNGGLPCAPASLISVQAKIWMRCSTPLLRRGSASWRKRKREFTSPKHRQYLLY